MLSRNTNFDYLGLRDESNKLFKRVSYFLDTNGEKQYDLCLFTDYMYKINSHLSKTKRILLVTDQTLYSLNLNLSLALKIPLKNI
jgi:hypothetical protein